MSNAPTPAAQPVAFWDSTSLAANTTVTYTLNTGQCYDCMVLINVAATTATKSTGVTLSIFHLSSESGTLCNTAFYSQLVNSTAAYGFSFVVPPGSYAVRMDNGSSVAIADLDGWYRLTT